MTPGKQFDRHSEVMNYGSPDNRTKPKGMCYTACSGRHFQEGAPPCSTMAIINMGKMLGTTLQASWLLHTPIQDNTLFELPGPVLQPVAAGSSCSQPNAQAPPVLAYGISDESFIGSGNQK